MNKVLVTGASGFVGKHLLGELLNNGIEVVAIDSNPNKSNATVSFQAIDLTNKQEVSNIDFKKIASVIHLAGLANVGLSFNNPLDYLQTNLSIEVNLFEEALRQKANPKFLIISSGSLYDSSAKLPLTEKSPVLPSSPYAVSKLGQEQLAQYYITRGFRCVIARPFNHIGPDQKPGFLVPDLIEQIKSAKENNLKEISVGNLNTKRDYTDVRDIARAYRLLLDKGKSGEIYNICSGKSLSGYEILGALTKALGINIKPIVDQSKIRPSDVMDIYGSHDKITLDTGWKPEIDINTTLKDILATI